MMGLVMLALLAAAPVHAERWTLWAHGTGHSGAEEWQRVQGSATEAECWASFAGLQFAEAGVTTAITTAATPRIARNLEALRMISLSSLDQ